MPPSSPSTDPVVLVLNALARAQAPDEVIAKTALAYAQQPPVSASAPPSLGATAVVTIKVRTPDGRKTSVALPDSLVRAGVARWGQRPFTDRVRQWALAASVDGGSRSSRVRDALEQALQQAGST